MKRFCPIHEYERYECGPECRARRKQFKAICHSFNVLWHDRMRRGVKYVSLARVLRCPVCRHLFAPQRGNQLFCSIECRRRQEHWRRYARLKAAA